MVSETDKIIILNKVHKECQKNNCKLLYAIITGSHAYGMANELSDIDCRFVFLSPEEHYLGFGGIDSMPIDGQDIFGYEFRKWILLAYKNNPSVLEMLFMPNNNVLFIDDTFRSVLENAWSFVSKQCYNSYINYAENQIKKAKTCTKDIVDKLEALEQCLVKNGIDYSNLSVKQCVRDLDGKDLPDFVLEKGSTIGHLIDYFKNFRQNYWPYSDLGKKRREYIKKHNFDSKNCSHAIRLGRTCLEIFRDSKLLVERYDADYLLKIKNGFFSILSLELEFLEIKKECTFYKNKSTIQDVPDINFIEKLTIDLLKKKLFKCT